MCPQAPTMDPFTVKKHGCFLVGGAYLEAQALARWLLLILHQVYDLVDIINAWKKRRGKKASFPQAQWWLVSEET